MQFFPVLQKKNLNSWQSVVNRSTAQKLFFSQNIAIIVFGFLVAVADAFYITIVIRYIGENHIRRNHFGVWFNTGSISICGNSRSSSSFLFIFAIISVDSLFNMTLLLLLFQSSIAPRFLPRFFSDQNGLWSRSDHLFDQGRGSYIWIPIFPH